jgi:hypothetical protein
MKYEYTPVSDHDTQGKRKKRPLVAIEIFGPNRTMHELALIDSGADVSLFSLEITELAGIDLSNAKHIRMIDITGNDEAWLTEVQISVQHLEQKLTIPAAFIKSPYVGVLLGQEEFFN